MNKPARKRPADELYMVCPICNGKARIGPEGPGTDHPPPDAEGLVTCPCCNGDRFIRNGLTLHYVVKLINGAERAEAELERLCLEHAALESAP